MDIGRGWITLDGKEVITVRVPSFYDEDHTYSTKTMGFGRAVGSLLQMSIDDAIAASDETH